MKRAIVLLALLFCVNSYGLEKPQVVMFIDGTNTALYRAMASEKECAGITLINGQIGVRGPAADWAMAQSVGNGRGKFEIWLENMSQNRDIFLGKDVHKAAKQACRIIKGS